MTKAALLLQLAMSSSAAMIFLTRATGHKFSMLQAGSPVGESTHVAETRCL